MATQTFRCGSWQVDPNDNSISHGNLRHQMEPRAMDVLVALCKVPNTIVSAEALLEQCWGSTLYGDNPVHKVITQLRRLLGDQASNPSFIETIRKRGYRIIASVEFDAPSEAQAGTWLEESPFRGLQAFDEKHAKIFFGRNDAVFGLTKLLLTQINLPDPVELIMVLGPSGSGKTSLIQAGLLPTLINPAPRALAASEQVGAISSLQLVSHSGFDLAEKGEHSLLNTLAGMLLDLEVANQPVFPGYSADSLARQLQQDPAPVLALLQQSMRHQPAAAPQIAQRHVLFIDRFEAVFDEKTVSLQENRLFLRILEQLASTGALLILLACRNDFYPYIAANPVLMAGKARGAHFDLAPPSQAEIAQMIRLPALAARLTFGVDESSQMQLDELLCQSANGSPDALPLLQYTLSELYRLRSDQGELSFSAYHQLGGMEGAIGHRAEQVVAGMSEAQKQSLPQVLSLVATLSSQDNTVTSRRAAWSLLRNDNERQVVNALVESRLFVSELVDGAPGFGVAHEALLRRWPRVVEWIRTHRSALQIRRRIGELALRWQNEARSQDLLLPEGRQLDEACSLLALSTFALSPQELSLIGASLTRVRWRRRLRLAALGVIIALSLLALGLGLSAISAKRQAQERRVEVEGLMGFMLGDFAEKLRPLARLDLLDSVGARALDYYAKSQQEELSQTALTQRALALQVLAEVRLTRGDPQAAREALKASHQILLKQLAERPKDLVVLKNLANNVTELGKTHIIKSEWALAAPYYAKRLEYSDLLNRLDPDNPEWWSYQSAAHNNAGGLAFRQLNFRAANAHFLTAYELIQRARAKNPLDPALKRDSATIVSWLGTLQSQYGKLHEAMQLHQQEAAILTSLHQEKPLDALWAGDLPRALRMQADLYVAFGQKDQALPLYQNMERLLKRNLQQEPNNQEWLRNLAVAQMGIQAALPEQTDPLTILSNLQQIGQVSTRLLQIDPNNPDWVNRHTGLLLRQVNHLLKMQRNLEAEQKLANAEALQEKLLASHTTIFNIKLTMAGLLLSRAELETRRGNLPQARLACLRGQNLLADAAKDSADYRILDPWVRLHLCLNESEAAKLPIRKLTAIGYRDADYLQKISSTK